MRRITLRTAIAALSAAACLTLMAAPASANTVSVSITSGTVDVYAPFGSTPEASIPLGGSGSCSSNNSVTATGTPSSGTVSASISTVSEVIDPFGDGVDYLSTLTTTLSGTYSGTAITINNESATAELEKLASSCTPDTSQGVCTVTASDIDLTGSLTSGSFPTLMSGDTASISGGNTDFDTSVTDTGTACGKFSAVNNGRVDLTADLEVD